MVVDGVAKAEGAQGHACGCLTHKVQPLPHMLLYVREAEVMGTQRGSVSDCLTKS